MTTFVQEAGVLWNANTQGTTKTITMASSVAVGDLVVVVMGYSHSIINSVTGLGATWTVIRSREGSVQQFPSAEIWYATAVTAGTTITITPNSSFVIDQGCAYAWQFNGATGAVRGSATSGGQTNATSRSTQGVAAQDGDIYVGSITESRSLTTTYTSTESPGPFDLKRDVYNSPGTAGANYMFAGYRIATGSETPTRLIGLPSASSGIPVAAVFVGTPSAFVGWGVPI